MSTTPTTDFASAQDSALDTLVELTNLDPLHTWTEAQAQVQNVRLSAAALIIQAAAQQPPDLSFLFNGGDEEPEDGAEAEVHTLESVQPEPSGDFLDPHGAPPIGGTS